MSFAAWMLVIGSLLLAMALGQPVIRRLPVTPAILYLLLGIGLGPVGLNVIQIDPVADSRLLHHAAEIGVIISLFSVGMKLRLPLGALRLRPALCLASISMVVTVMLVAATGVMFLGLSIGEAILLGAILAPTDPVLASEVQIQNPRDHDKVRLTLSAEAGWNDGTAFPFVMLGLGLLGLHDLGSGGWRWGAVDLLWAVVAGLAIGAALGHTFGKLMLRLHTRRGKAVELGEYLVLGLIAVSYGAAVQLKAYGFLAVFAAGMALRAVERKASPSDKVVDESMAAAADGSGGGALRPESQNRVRVFCRSASGDQRTPRALAGSRSGADGGRHRHDRRARSGGNLVCSFVVSIDPAARGPACVGLRSVFSEGIRRDCLVRDPWDRVALLSDVCDRPRFGG